MMGLVPYLAIVALIILSAFFSGSEMAFASVNELRLRKLSENGNRSARLALLISENFQKTLTTILIGNNLVNIAASSVSAVIIIGLMGEAGVLVSSLVMTVLILIFGEITPKIIGKTYSTKMTLFAAYPLKVLMVLLTPVNGIILFIVEKVSRLWLRQQEDEPEVTEEELMTIIENVEDEGIIDKDFSDLLQATLLFSEIQVQEILTPRTDMLAVDIEDGFAEILAVALHSPYSRIPVFEEKIDNVIGIMYVERFLLKYFEAGEFDPREILMEPTFVHKTIDLQKVFKLLNQKQLHMAIVIDEYGGTMGCVTMEDVLEQLVGEIWDESDEVVKDYVELEEGGYLVSGDLSIRDFTDLFDLSQQDFVSEYTTIGGWVMEVLDEIPKDGMTIEHKNVIFVVKEVDTFRIKQLLIKIDQREDGYGEEPLVSMPERLCS